MSAVTTSTDLRAIVEEYYGLIDSGDLHSAVLLMTPDAKLTFANAEPVFGQEAAEASIQLVLDQTTKIKHDVVTWYDKVEEDGTRTALFEIRIRYDLKSGTVITNPGCVFAAFDAEGRFTEQRLYGDLSNVFAG